MPLHKERLFSAFLNIQVSNSERSRTDRTVRNSRWATGSMKSGASRATLVTQRGVHYRVRETFCPMRRR